MQGWCLGRESNDMPQRKFPINCDSKVPGLVVVQAHWFALRISFLLDPLSCPPQRVDYLDLERKGFHWWSDLL